VIFPAVHGVHCSFSEFALAGISNSRGISDWSFEKALRLPRVNLFIADDVELGKTIEAGLLARELLMRKKVRDIVVACPPSMLLQWEEELDARFGRGEL
jgi:SNF2 family DNA or RNA helicase